LISVSVRSSCHLQPLAALGIPVVASLVVIIVPLALSSKSTGQQRLDLRDVVFLVCLGVGFMALEVPLARILSLYLGHPVFGFPSCWSHSSSRPVSLAR
jgi:hypothetical protein